MKKLRKIASVLMLAATVVFAVGCTKPDEPNNGGVGEGFEGKKYDGKWRERTETQPRLYRNFTETQPRLYPHLMETS